MRRWEFQGEFKGHLVYMASTRPVRTKDEQKTNKRKTKTKNKASPTENAFSQMNSERHSLIMWTKPPPILITTFPLLNRLQEDVFLFYHSFTKIIYLWIPSCSQKLTMKTKLTCALVKAQPPCWLLILCHRFSRGRKTVMDKIHSKHLPPLIKLIKT